MINNIDEFRAQYESLCRPAIKALNEATEKYNLSLKTLIITHFCNEKDFDEWRSNIWETSRLDYDCDPDEITESMILETMVSTLESRFHKT